MNQNPGPEPSLISELRKVSGLTQAQAADLIHATRRGWQEYEAGNRRMHPGLWELFCLKINFFKLQNNS